MQHDNSPDPQGLFADAFVHHQAGRLDEAASLYRHILAAEPSHADSLHLLGMVAYQTGQYASAIDLMSQAIASNPRVPLYHSNLGNALLLQQRPDEAIAAYQQAIDLAPDFPDAHYNLANVLKDTGRLEEALLAYQRALELKPDLAGAHNNLGNLLWEMGRLADAEASCRTALHLEPNFLAAHLNLGNALRLQGRLTEAVTCYRAALRLDPNFPEAHFYLGMALLALGDMAAGWQEYEWRFKTPDGIQANPGVKQPQWRGEPAAGKTLLIQAEGGHGDTLQFCRYATLAAARGLRVILAIQPPLVRLLRPLPGVDLVLGGGEQMPTYDLYCPMLSLPLAFGTTLASIPNPAAYLQADAAQAASWQARLSASASQGRRIGLVWAGNPRPGSRTLAAVDRRRSLPPERLAPLFDIPGLHFFSLQKGGPQAPAHLKLADFMDEMADFADTAALIANLDLVISVDTATAHLAAAMGKPVWLLERLDSCFRWLVGRRDSPWYPTVRLYRQPQPGDWDSVLAEVTSDLRDFANESRTGNPVGRIADERHEPVHDLFATAFAHHQAGRLTDAEALYQQILATHPTHADSLHLLGMTAYQTGRHDSAAALISRAIRANDSVALYHSNLGNVLFALRNLTGAAACYRDAIARNPGFADGHYNLGNVLKELGQRDEAVICFRRAIELKPDLPAAHNNLGNLLWEQGRSEEAADCCRRAIALHPGFAEAHLNLGNALQEQGHTVEAIACYRRALDLRPDLAEAHNSLGNLLNIHGQPNEAMGCFEKALALRPDFADAHYNLGSTLMEQQRTDEAVTSIRRALTLRPDFPDALLNLGNLLRTQGRLEEAINCYRRAIDVRPDYPDGHFNLSVALLAAGQMTEGWKEYEWRWKTPQMIGGRRDVSQPLWQGEAAAGRTLLIHAEQGFGDTLHFCRYAPLAAASGLRVILAVQAPLVRLLRSLPGVDLVLEKDEKPPDFDLHCPMLSLPLAFGTTIATVPNATPYLQADETQVAAWRRRLAVTGNQRRRVGLVWAGSPGRGWPGKAAEDRRRSLSPHLLAPLFDVPGLQFFSLQKTEPKAPGDFPLTNFMDEMEDFADTAALIANLDLVISVCTAVAHLSAALGKPVWLLDRFDPCWRWLTGRRDSPWYPTLRLYRQPQPGDWDTVLAEVKNDLQRFASA